MSGIRMRAATLLVYALSIIEVPWFLLRYRALFRNRVVFVFWLWSFGHTVTGLDSAARMFFPDRISLIYLPHPRSNPWLAECFGHTLDAYIYRSIRAPRGGLVDAPRVRVLTGFLRLLAALTRKFEVIDLDAVYARIAEGEPPTLLAREPTGKLEPSMSFARYVRLLSDGVGHPPALPAAIIRTIRQRILAVYPDFFSRPFVTLGLREKGRHEPFDSSMRTAGPQENYRPAVAHLTDAGYNVIGTSDTRDELFADIDGYFSLSRIGLPAPLLNVFALTTCSLFIGQQSGPLALPDSCGIPCLICDALPHRLGTFRSQDLLLFKHLRDRQTGRELSLIDIYVLHPELAFGGGFAASDVVIEPNTPEEILEAVVEAIELVEGRLELSGEDEALIQRFRALIPPEMAVSYQGNRMTLGALRRSARDVLASSEALASEGPPTAPSPTR